MYCDKVDVLKYQVLEVRIQYRKKKEKNEKNNKMYYK